MQPNQISDTSPGVPEGVLEQALLDGQEAFRGFLLKRLGERANAEDVLQEFSVRVLARKDHLRQIERMDSWLYTVLRSTLNDFHRKSGRQERLGASYALEPQAVEIFVDSAASFARICACVRGLIPQLRPVDANIIHRIDIHDEDRKSVATDLDLTTRTLAVRLFRARAALRDKLLDHCGPCCSDGFEDCSCLSATYPIPAHESGGVQELRLR